MLDSAPQRQDAYLGKQRLLQLADDLDREFEHEKVYNQRFFAEQITVIDGKKFYWTFNSIVRKDQCGSSGCALGYYATKYKQDALVGTSRYDYFNVDDEVMRKHFGISDSLYFLLFYDNTIYGAYHALVTPQMVAAAIRRVCSDPYYEEHFVNEQAVS